MFSPRLIISGLSVSVSDSAIHLRRRSRFILFVPVLCLCFCLWFSLCVWFCLKRRPSHVWRACVCVCVCVSDSVRGASSVHVTDIDGDGVADVAYSGVYGNQVCVCIGVCTSVGVCDLSGFVSRFVFVSVSASVSVYEFPPVYVYLFPGVVFGALSGTQTLLIPTHTYTHNHSHTYP